MAIAPISNDNIKVGYISEDDGYVKGKSIAQANAYEALNPGTTYIFLNGDNKVEYLSIDEVNQLTSKNLLRTDPCKVGPQPCPPPTLEFYGGGGIGAEANPVVDRQGNLLAADLVNGGFGYETPPFVSVVDPCRSGSGAVLNTEIRDGVVIRIIINETGTGYLPPKEAAPQYPAILQLSEVRVDNPGINYDSGNDEIVIEPANGTQLSYTVEPFGKISKVKVLRSGNFTELPNIRMNTTTGVNASFTPVFDVVRDPLPVEPVAKDIVQVFDLVGLNINGYVGGKEYYGNVYFKDGVKFAGTGWIQVTGRYNHTRFSEYLEKIGKADPRILEEGKTYTAEVYPWSISGFWWDDNGMNEYCESWPDMDKVGARVNGKYLPNGYQDRRDYTNRAFEILGL